MINQKPIQGRNNRQVSPEKSQERELWFKMVVKVISWRDGPRERSSKVLASKITPEEWASYCKEVIKINAGTSKEKTQKKLDEVVVQIKKHGGFA